jgi:hypothetical protein
LGGSTVTKGKQFNFYSSNIYNSTLEPVLSLKEIEEKIQKKFSLGIRSKELIFRLKNFLKNLLVAFSTWYYPEKKYKKLR